MYALNLRITRRLGWLLGVPLVIVFGCAGQNPATTSPTQQDHGRDAPLQQPEETPPPSSQRPAEPELPPAPGPHGSSNGSAVGAVSQDEIEAFADIQISFVPLQQQLTQEAQAGASQEQLQQLQGQLQQQADQIILSSALNTDRFNEITRQIQHDSDLQHRVRMAIEQKTGGR